ncbi:hypothetical protein A1O3_08512 [Capronia epimyces CBS 606.96]|uniref:CFEM domain-containing protein n=1 Tax=Capronia epimyces CBS 606.96 TaxID=1182542 RepID=W9XPV7_9EURO|nr:uncharacterized protein A1O3_08512 [Capronia epimyces CBS 606.96]EXJ79011.1 hypothetical protein A1O3_08512 [Capronia epimyces CBS 606.96]
MYLSEPFIVAGYLLVASLRIVTAQYTGWGLLPACAQQCFSDALLIGASNCGKPNVDKSQLRACICTDCEYTETVRTCFETSPACGGSANTAAVLSLNSGIFCNGSVYAEVRMWAGSLIWNSGSENSKPATVTLFQLPTACGLTSTAVSGKRDIVNTGSIGLWVPVKASSRP